MSVSQLGQEKCQVCEGYINPLGLDDIKHYMTEIDSEWQVNEKGHLVRQYKFKNFKEALDFANKIGKLAEEEGHHPNLIVGWGRCTIELWSHNIKGLSKNDFILSSKIDALGE
ncbi:4a-hydroxytetrahydrobiopterin dehydratase [Candidatus Nucleicultrix amoebiphila]|jgi:4a-hydroxytetrahydrobiopterin dehydratase|uniref:Putative pterin-4-alpha-carbinolamine dehydratase n=1 Tax=Candidatus Nucleicultrix amoebiphila FS5 TaxID=1414854 RepID=A0A1W6N3W4_9PROT|nr:4a-hydroxytetrahydrobiopterin dehydratase [Candidatus Nucleicultrix amoebiphila]ARN84466.1 pterin-4-alpha-carbinolamine dehydratase [Candidatus Nucleicultrix amoebiphila FS5]